MTVIWFSSGFKWAAFGYIALPTTYLSRHIVWDSFLLFWVYRREWLCCWFISIQFIHYLLFLHWTYFYWIFVVLSTVLVTGGKKMIRPYCNPKETVEMGSHTSCCIARLGRNIKCCVKMSQPRWAISVVGDSEEGGGAVRLNFSEEAMTKYDIRKHRMEAKEMRKQSEKKTCQDPEARQYSSSL